jgi:DNA polymerase III epsilon subunit-like protein
MIPDDLRGDVLTLDCETAVLGDRVIEIGLSLFRNCELINEWGMRINPTIPIDPEASKVHNIYDKDVEDAPKFVDVAWVIYNNLNAADILVAYNYEYDRGVLGKEFDRVGIKWPIKPAVDPFILFKQYNKFNKGKKLVNAAEKYGVPYIGAHKAVNDATVTGKMLFKMAAIRTNFPRNIQELLKKQREWVQYQYEDFSKYRASKGQSPIDVPNYRYFEEIL